MSYTPLTTPLYVIRLCGAFRQLPEGIGVSRRAEDSGIKGSCGLYGELGCATDALDDEREDEGIICRINRWLKLANH